MHGGSAAELLLERLAIDLLVYHEGGLLLVASTRATSLF
jgi:hypothetical protein